MTIPDGVSTIGDGAFELKNGTTKLADKASVVSGRSYYDNGWKYENPSAAYVLGKMGYTLLSGEVLNYVNEETRLG